MNVKMMQRSLILSLMLFLTVPASAQGNAAVGNCHVEYRKEHLLFQRGEETNVIDIDVEWPSMIDFSSVKPLQAFLAKAVFRADADNLEDACKLMKARFGQPVTALFKTIPDDDKFCYVTCRLQEMGYLKNRFISYRSTYICAPGKESAQKADTVTMLLTYDLVHGKVMLMKDVLKTGQLQASGVPSPVLAKILHGANVDVPDDLLGLQIMDACLMDRCVWLDMLYATEYETRDFHSLVMIDDLKSVMTRDARKLFTVEIPNRQLESVSLDSLYENQPVYTHVDKAPEFRGGAEGLKRYLAENIDYPLADQAFKVYGRVVVSFIVDEKGEIKDIRVVDRVSPGLDREAVRVVRLMPRWLPGELKGRKVKVRCQLPISFKLHSSE